METRNKIISLIESGDKDNITLAVQLAKSQYNPLYQELYLLCVYVFTVKFRSLGEEERYRRLKVVTSEENILDEIVDVLIQDQFILNMFEYPNKKNYPISETLKYMKNLKVLRLDCQKLNEIPEWIFKLHKLEALTLKDNNIKVVPKEINNLKNLKALELARNQLTEFPDVFGCESLRSLYINVNQITHVSEEIADKIEQLENFRSLGIYNNPVEYSDIPQSMKKYVL